MTREPIRFLPVQPDAPRSELEWLGLQKAFALTCGAHEAQQRMLVALLKAGGEVLTYAEIASACGVSPGGRSPWEYVTKAASRLRDCLSERGLQGAVWLHMGLGYSIPAKFAPVIVDDLVAALQSVEERVAA